MKELTKGFFQKHIDENTVLYFGQAKKYILIQKKTTIYFMLKTKKRLFKGRLFKCVKKIYCVLILKKFGNIENEFPYFQTQEYIKH